MSELIIRQGDEYALTPQTNNQLVLLETQIVDLTKKRDEMRKLIMQAMQEEGIYKMENEDISITYIAETERETFDSKRFHEEHANLYHLYTKTSKVAPSIRVKVK